MNIIFCFSNTSDYDYVMRIIADYRIVVDKSNREDLTYTIQYTSDANLFEDKLISEGIEYKRTDLS